MQMFCNSNSTTSTQQEASLVWQTLFDFHEIFTAQSPPHVLVFEMDLVGVRQHHPVEAGSNAEPFACCARHALMATRGVRARSTLLPVLIQIALFEKPYRE